MPKFDVNNKSIQTLVGWVKSGEVAIPEIQRPFVWNSTQVRDLLDSLYKGFPIGYIITWNSPSVKLKDGTLSNGKKIIIDGQQRITALQAAMVGLKVTNKNYKKVPIKIAFNPQSESFQVYNAAIEKDNAWIPDISIIFDNQFSDFKFLNEYCMKNNIIGDEQKNEVFRVITKLKSINNISVGVIELQDLSIDEVTEIFIRINSKGSVLSQADFVMSKISSDDKYGGNETRKLIDYFCHLLERPGDYESIAENDVDFSSSDLMSKIKWIINESEDIYTPDYTDVLRVAFTYKFHRGKLADLVSLLSGRNFVTRENEEDIVKESFELLREGVEQFINQTYFKRYIMILHSAGILVKGLVRSQNVLNFGYILYLLLRDKDVDNALIEKIVRRWVVLCILTGRYSGSPESVFDYDVKRFSENDPMEIVDQAEAGELSEAFWNSVLVQRLDTSVDSSPYFKMFLIAQTKAKSRGFLSEHISVHSLLEQHGDVHHIFPKNYLQKNGYSNRRDYNQIANYAFTQTEINIKIKDDSPNLYMKKVLDQIHTGSLLLGGITSYDDLLNNFKENCIPEGMINMNVENYQDFLKQRRVLMAQFIKKYYESIK